MIRLHSNNAENWKSFLQFNETLNRSGSYSWCYFLSFKQFSKIRYYCKANSHLLPQKQSKENEIWIYCCCFQQAVNQILEMEISCELYMMRITRTRTVYKKIKKSLSIWYSKTKERVVIHAPRIVWRYPLSYQIELMS